MGDAQNRRTAEEIIGKLREVEIRVARGQSQTQTDADPGIQIEDVVPLLFDQPIATTRLDGLTAETMKAAHELVEARRMIGKVVMAT
jgi:hypothetical protein